MKKNNLTETSESPKKVDETNERPKKDQANITPSTEKKMGRPKKTDTKNAEKTLKQSYNKKLAETLSTTTERPKKDATKKPVGRPRKADVLDTLDNPILYAYIGPIKIDNTKSFNKLCRIISNMDSEIKITMSKKCEQITF